MSIQAIDQTSIHRLTSGQVVIDLQTAVKELLENALDAGATSIEIRFKEHGIDSIEVQDNGKGIDSSDWAGIALKHHTSKLTTYEDLTSVDTLGFRGEALSSLCGTATLSIITSTISTAPAGTSLSFSSDGNCIVGSKVARSKGTTVVVKELFKSLPVRRKDLIKNAKREFGKALELVQSYALIKIGCRIEVKNSVKGKWSTHLQTPASTSIRSNFSSIFAPKSLATMMNLELTLDVAADKIVLKRSEPGAMISTQVIVTGLISKPTTGNGRPTGGRQFFYINGRPFNPTKLSKAINEVYKSFVNGSFPCIIADFQLPPDAYDVNVSPDKRTIFLHSEGNLITALKIALEEMYQPSRSTYPMAQIDGPNSKSKSTTTPASTSSKSLSNSPIVQPVTKDDSDIIPIPSKRKRAISVASDDIDKSDLEDYNTAEDLNMDMDLDNVESETRTSLEKDDLDLGIGSSKKQKVQFNTESLSSPRPYRKPSLLNSSSSSSSLLESSSPPPINLPLEKEINEEANEFNGDLPPPFSSPSPPPQIAQAQPQHFKQITLDTTGASWAKKLPPAPLSTTSTSNFKKTGNNALKAAVKHLNQFVNPSQIQQKLTLSANNRMDVEEEEEEEEGEEEVEEEEEVQDEEELEVVKIEEDNSDDEVVIIKEDRVSEQDELNEVNTSLDQERIENLELLDKNGERSFRDEIIGNSITADINLQIDMESVSSHWKGSFRNAIGSTSKVQSDPLVGASVEQNLEEAEATLSRVVNKEDFDSMQVIGQFNLGFIIARRKVSVGKGKGKERMLDQDSLNDEEQQDDLFIIDQHASDEKYNFEKLQADTVIQSQRLLQPRLLNLPSHDEITAIEHSDIFRMNGFELLIDEEAEVGKRVKLLAQPVSKDTVFGVEDLEELLDLINSRSNEEIVRPSKARKMFAMRACRKSVMIGKALNTNQMTQVIRHMGGMVQPWACPHGRPTMRWLASLGINSKKEKRSNIPALLSRFE